MKEDFSVDNVQNQSVDQSLLDAYLSTVYWVDDKTNFCIQIDTYSTLLAQLHQRCSVSSSAFITAYNPYSVLQSKQENKQANTALLKQIKSMGYTCLTGRGQAINKADWPAEESFLVLGISREEAVRLGNCFKQNAIIYTDNTAIPKLVLLAVNTLI